MNFYVIIFVFIHGAAAAAVNENNLKVTFLEAGDVKILPGKQNLWGNDLQIFCYRGNVKTLGRIFETIELQLEIENDDFTQYNGETPEIVETHHQNHKSIFSITLFSQKKTRITLLSFSQQCIGIETSQPYRVYVRLIRVDFWRVIQMTVGILVFIFAAKLSHNSIFYYITGVLLGICASFMLLIYLVGKLFPKRPMMYGVLIGGWAIGIYVIQMLWENIQLIVLTYRMYVFWYIVSTGFISFVICYRFGPPKNKRSKDLIKWGLQLLSLFAIYFASQFEEGSASVIILTFLMHYFPKSWLRKLRSFYLKRFPPKRRLLTNEEYYEQGVKETTKALDELRSYCSSPECKQWQTMRKLKYPLRFAEFVDGASHIKDEEILLYESSKYENSSETEDEMSEEAISWNRNKEMLNHSPRTINDYDEISEDEDDDREYYKAAQWKSSLSQNGYRNAVNEKHSANRRSSSSKIIKNQGTQRRRLSRNISRDED